MIKILLTSFAFFFLSAICYGQKQFLVVIDPGHGGRDSGAVGYGGILEKDITLAISIKLKNELANKGISSVLTRQSDKFIPLSPVDQRSNLSNVLNASLFISVHLNSGSFSGSGAECYVSKFKGADKHKRESVILSELVLNKLSKNLGFKTRGTQFGDFSVIRNTIEKCPSVLLELGFISNKPEMDFILGKGADLIAQNIAESIIEFKKMNN